MAVLPYSVDFWREFFLAVSLYWLVFFSLYFFSWKEKVNKKFKDGAIAPRARPCRGTTISECLSRSRVILGTLTFIELSSLKASNCLNLLVLLIEEGEGAVFR